jgi:uncharacterized lipoprotein YddW (UPF0748 family)
MLSKNLKVVVILTSFLLSNCNKSTIPSLSPTPFYPKHELRGVWIATVANIDWPSNKNLTATQQQTEYENIIKAHAKTGLNAAFVQVRAASDAFFGIQTEPWSEWLTGTQGKAPVPYYDPMKFMISKTHENNMEFHAWLNLNRGIHKSAKSVAPDHITNTKPEWFLKYDGYVLYDFGIPEVRNYINSVVKQIVDNYDVDGIHFDDYFYPYTVANEVFPDQSSFEKYGKEFANVEDWRRNNIDLLIKQIAKTIKDSKPYVKFGISPFGVWRNATSDPKGSDTQGGQTSFDNLYADTRKWALDNWVDYMVPQIYFSGMHPKVPYRTLTDWWVKNTNNRHLYIGLAAYKVNVDADATWKNHNELPSQIRYNRNTKNVKGALFFSSKSLIRNELGLTDSLKILYSKPALTPTMPWIKMPKLSKPSMNAPEKINGTQVKLSWEIKDPNAKAVIVYRFKNGDRVDFENAFYLVAQIPLETANFAILDHNEAYLYAIRTVDRLSNESPESELYSIK